MIMTKVVQMRLQKLLQDVIHPSQSAFLPSRHILDFIMIQHETIAWARETN